MIDLKNFSRDGLEQICSILQEKNDEYCEKLGIAHQEIGALEYRIERLNQELCNYRSTDQLPDTQPRIIPMKSYRKNEC